MDAFDMRLRSRMERLETTLPVGGAARRRKPQIRLTLGMVGGVAAVALLSGVVAGASVVSDAVRGHPGLFGPDGPLHCTRIQEMQPEEAASVLATLGYSVIWQVEDRDSLRSEQTSQAPPDGYIIEGLREGSSLVLVVERGVRAEPAVPSC